VDLELRGKVAIVTGGSQGIGKAIARELAAEGCTVAIVSRTEPALTSAARELATDTGQPVRPFVADVTQDEAVRTMVTGVLSAFGRVDVLVNCAARPTGIGPQPMLAEVNDQLFFGEMNVKVMGYLRCAREVAPHMARQGWGRIINVDGMAARQARAAVGSMRNVALVALTKYLAEELGPLGINVSVIHPLVVRTENQLAAIARQAAEQHISPVEVERRIAQSSAIRRLIDPQEIAHIVAFLASPKAAAINGDVIAAGGGVGSAIYL
jgi:NAD(P)-dependent dehydrogenase (short-subunit alcohol dehydrogenase family)